MSDVRCRALRSAMGSIWRPGTGCALCCSIRTSFTSQTASCVQRRTCARSTANVGSLSPLFPRTVPKWQPLTRPCLLAMCAGRRSCASARTGTKKPSTLSNALWVPIICGRDLSFPQREDPVHSRRSRDVCRVGADMQARHPLDYPTKDRVCRRLAAGDGLELFDRIPLDLDRDPLLGTVLSYDLIDALANRCIRLGSPHAPEIEALQPLYRALAPRGRSPHQTIRRPLNAGAVADPPVAFDTDRRLRSRQVAQLSLTSPALGTQIVRGRNAECRILERVCSQRKNLGAMESKE